jgi:CspA family cold shock protein
MATGKVAWFDGKRGFGFVRPDTGEKDIFVHITAVQKAGLCAITDGDDIIFDFGEHNGKRAAVNLLRRWP